MQTQQTQTVQYTNNTKVVHKKHFSIAQRNARNAQYVTQYTAQQIAQAQAIAQALQALYFKQHVNVNYNARSISIQLQNATAIQAVQYIAKQYNASIKQTQNNVLLHIAQQQ
jgi:DNA-binding transcriptional regulator LsrR (DeoR family)